MARARADERAARSDRRGNDERERPDLTEVGGEVEQDPHAVGVVASSAGADPGEKVEGRVEAGVHVARTRRRAEAAVDGSGDDPGPERSSGSNGRKTMCRLRQKSAASWVRRSGWVIPARPTTIGGSTAARNFHRVGIPQRMAVVDRRLDETLRQRRYACFVGDVVLLGVDQPTAKISATTSIMEPQKNAT